MNTPKNDAIQVFSTKLGWMAIRGADQTLRALSFGNESPDAAIAAVEQGDGPADVRSWNKALARRLRAYAAGDPDDFSDLDIALPPRGTFRRRVLEACRQIPYGETRTYGELAAAAGSPGAARAVGNCMARNCIPLVVPCHRVVPSAGKFGRFSAPGGTATKQRLLTMEARGAAVAQR